MGVAMSKEVELNADKTKKVLEKAESRKRKGGGVEIKYKRKWLHLCRTDLKDDIRTWTSWSSHGNISSVGFYNKNVYGARITKDAFFVIDRFSDG